MIFDIELKHLTTCVQTTNHSFIYFLTNIDFLVLTFLHFLRGKNILFIMDV